LSDEQADDSAIYSDEEDDMRLMKKMMTAMENQQNVGL
jgi:hypothetical protein